MVDWALKINYLSIYLPIPEEDEINVPMALSVFRDGSYPWSRGPRLYGFATLCSSLLAAVSHGVGAVPPL